MPRSFRESLLQAISRHRLDMDADADTSDASDSVVEALLRSSASVWDTTLMSDELSGASWTDDEDDSHENESDGNYTDEERNISGEDVDSDDLASDEMHGVMGSYDHTEDGDDNDNGNDSEVPVEQTNSVAMEQSVHQYGGDADTDTRGATSEQISEETARRARSPSRHLPLIPAAPGWRSQSRAHEDYMTIDSPLQPPSPEGLSRQSTRQDSLEAEESSGDHSPYAEVGRHPYGEWSADQQLHGHISSNNQGAGDSGESAADSQDIQWHSQENGYARNAFYHQRPGYADAGGENAGNVHAGEIAGNHVSAAQTRESSDHGQANASDYDTPELASPPEYEAPWLDRPLWHTPHSIDENTGLDILQWAEVTSNAPLPSPETVRRIARQMMARHAAQRQLPPPLVSAPPSASGGVPQPHGLQAQTMYPIQTGGVMDRDYYIGRRDPEEASEVDTTAATIYSEDRNTLIGTEDADSLAADDDFALGNNAGGRRISVGIGGTGVGSGAARPGSTVSFSLRPRSVVSMDSVSSSATGTGQIRRSSTAASVASQPAQSYNADGHGGGADRPAVLFTTVSDAFLLDTASSLDTLACIRRPTARVDVRTNRMLSQFDRLNMTEIFTVAMLQQWIPELNLAIVASQKGCVALTRIIRTYRSSGGTHRSDIYRRAMLCHRFHYLAFSFGAARKRYRPWRVQIV
ncbi:hypothetical protein THASP1DRAFT_25433 [Thamnocephalis sphaerospora]|uniref:Uncharacterized protein n=1 Tax=Thamnocephalis sphaerospora TaxID=78915 RepID=A0A4P9XKC4_9FUNG|nr:hypothetical protein THASP1DRAFT_25433 [Thamnocephalis sphaerospora]|eukprot:RKP06202.1 hypothetical protein THASP1DRAFT_25433 [Thamnocephalis sphaerospora]